jgi:hypothetical protein
MKYLKLIVAFSFLAGAMLWTGCGPAEWGEASIWGHGYTFHFQMPKPFKRSADRLELVTGRTIFENGYVTEGNEDNKFQIRTMELPVDALKMDGFTPRMLLQLALNRENIIGDRTLSIREFTDPNWPENVAPAEEFEIESADGTTIRHTRVLVYEALTGNEDYACYVLLTASRLKDKPRSANVDKFFNSLRICTGDKTPDRC